MMGARNTRGFSSCLNTGVLPPDSHITYEGVFNELKFDVGQKTQKIIDCHFGYARHQFSQSMHDPNMHDYLCLFLKSQRDGAERNNIPLNAVICLDISGSMDGRLEGKGEQTRLKLAIQAIKMFTSKLRPNDSVGMVVFDTVADVVFQQIFIKDFDHAFFELLDNQKTRGGTTISSGLTKSKEILQKFIEKNNISGAENRIIMLTDVGDNSIAGSLNFVNQASKNDNVHLTIVGLSNEFQSKWCEALKNVKGFNYFCAINESDIKKHIFQEFNFNFLPVAHNIQIKLLSNDVISFETFGAPDSAEVRKYNEQFKKQTDQFIVSRTSTVFPSQIEIKDGKLFTFGGVILIKLLKKHGNSQFKGQIRIKYLNLNQQNKQESFLLEFNFPQNQQYYTEQCLRQALQGYAFTSEIKNLLIKLKVENKEETPMYLNFVNYLQTVAPESKKKDLEAIKKILEKRIENKQPAKQ